MSLLPANPAVASLIAGQPHGVPLVLERQPSRVVALDFEIAASYDHVVEIGAVEIADGVLTGRTFHRLVRPRVPIAWFTAAIHGLTDRKLEGESYFVDIAEAFLDFLGDASIVAHAAHVERVVLERELSRLGHEVMPRSRFLCTMSMARRSRRFPRNGLRDVCAVLKIKAREARRGFHDALCDAEMTARVYLRLVESEKPNDTAVQLNSLRRNPHSAFENSCRVKAAIAGQSAGLGRPFKPAG